MLVHLSLFEIKKVLKSFKKSGSKYLLVTTQVKHAKNIDREAGFSWRKINFEIPPFNFPPALYYLNEKSPRKIESDKRLGLWRIEDIPDSFS